MRDEHMADIEDFDGEGQGVDLALAGDTIMNRHIATRASNKREIVVLTVGDGEYEGYSIGLDENSLQILEIASGDVVTVALEHIVSIKDGREFEELTGPEKSVVERRTASFTKSSQNWLVKNWPNIYDKRDDGQQPRQRTIGRPPRPGLGPNVGRGQMTNRGFEETRYRGNS